MFGDKRDSRKNSGFTLIELSILLAIMGIVTGGALLGQSLIRSSELKSVVSDVEQYKAAMQTFETKYKQLPGDMHDATYFWPSCVDNGANHCNGNSNGKISYGVGNGEGLRFWQHLSLSEFVSKSYEGGQYAGLTDQDNYPMALNHKLRVHYWDNLLDKNNNGIEMKKHVFYQFGDETELNEPTMTQIDIKYDDGKPHSGDIWLITDLGTASQCLTNSVPAEYDMTSSDQYTLSCVPAFIIDLP